MKVKRNNKMSNYISTSFITKVSQNPYPILNESFEIILLISETFLNIKNLYR